MENKICQLGPPRGIVPKEAFEGRIENLRKQRFAEVTGAIARYADAGLLIPRSWLVEFDEMIDLEELVDREK